MNIIDTPKVRPQDINAEDFLERMWRVNRLAATQFARYWRNLDEVTPEVCHVAWGFLNQHVDDFATTLCVNCEWPVFEGESHENCDDWYIELEIDREGCSDCGAREGCDCEGVTICEEARNRVWASR